MTERSGVAGAGGIAAKMRIFRNPWVSLFAILGGVGIGLEAKGLVPYLAPVGRLYLSLLQMCVLPIISCAIVVNLARLLRSGRVGKCVWRVMLYFSLTALTGAVVGCLIGLIARPGDGLSAEARTTLGQVFMTSAATLEGKSQALWGLLNTLVPSNVFFALSAGQTLAVIFVSILMGFALGMVKESSGRGLLAGLSGTYDTFFKILDWTLYGLPLGLLCLLSEQVGMLGVTILLALLKLIALFYAGCLVLCVLYIVNLRLTTGMPVFGVIKALGQPLVVALAAQSSIAALPLALERMGTKLKQPAESTGFVMPLGIVANRHSYVLLFALTAVFISQLYQVHLGPAQVVIVAVTATLSGMAAVGAPSVIAPLIAYVLAPVGLPAAAGIAIVVAIGPLVDSMASMTNLFGACTTTALVNSGGCGAEEEAPAARAAAGMETT
jgi:proton glutamate symport protein